MFKNSILLLALFICAFSFSQEEIKKDSVNIYTKIEAYSKRSKFNKFIHKLLFRSPQNVIYRNKTLSNSHLNSKQYKLCSNKIIREIKIEVLDPFGFSIENSKRVPKNSFEKAANFIHIQTQKKTIENLLLFEKNNTFDSLKVKESERLIRSQRFIRKVTIFAEPIENSKDSIDIVVRALDSWSLIPSGSISSSKGNLEITERNLFGFGHELQTDLSRDFTTSNEGFKTSYLIRNLYNTYINSFFLYENTILNQNRKQISMQKPFYSPIANWAGGILFEKNKYFENTSFNNEFETLEFVNKETFDTWFGYSFKLFDGNEVNFRSTKFIISARYLNEIFFEKPSLENYTNYFESKKTYLVSLAFNTVKFKQDSYIFNYEIPEDIAYGKIFSFTTGFDRMQKKSRPYIGFKTSYGDYFNFGYLNATFETGTYINKGTNEQSTLKFEMNYFSPLLNLGSWKMRQFLKPILILGRNRENSDFDRINLIDNNGIEGFNSRINGTKKIVFSWQTQFYIPGQWNGFHLSPFINFTTASLGNQNTKLFSEKFYSKFGFGFLINNDYLIFNRFQVSFAYYPNIPFVGEGIQKFNSFQNNDFSLPDYQLNQPYVVPFK